MKHSTIKRTLLLACFFLSMNNQAQLDTGKIRINGFASLIGGMTLNEGMKRNSNNPLEGETEAVYVADDITEGIYDNDLNFRPDTNYGLQVTANLGKGLSAIGQITGNGGEDFNATISWAYIRYNFNDNWQMKFGRQRLPYFFYSDFIDVGYAYHWIRPDPNLAANTFDSLDGVNLSWTASGDTYEWSAEAFFGSSVEDIAAAGSVIEFEDVVGMVLKASNDWLQLRASWSNSNANNGGGFTINGVPQSTDDNPLGFTFAGVGAQLTLGNVTIVGEWTDGAIDEPAGPDPIPDIDPVTPGNQPSPYGGLQGLENLSGWYLSTAIRFGDFTPHITYGEELQKFTQFSPGQDPVVEKAEQANVSVTAGLRWDFHPSAAFKIEYITVSDESDDFRKNLYGPFRIGVGDKEEVDLIAFGFDVIF